MKTLAEKLHAELTRQLAGPRKVVLRFPCACVIQSNNDSCSHVNAIAAKRNGRKWFLHNEELAKKKDAK